MNDLIKEYRKYRDSKSQVPDIERQYFDALYDFAVAQQSEIERLRDALRRIERIAPFYIADIATEALRNTKGENP